LYEGPSAPENKAHDFHVPIASSGLYWVIAISDDNLEVAEDGRSATLRVLNKAVIDEPIYPEVGPSYPAIMSFRVVWEADGDLGAYEDPAKYFRIDGYSARARAKVAVRVPELGFTWQSEPLESSQSVVAILGREVNGHYFEQGIDPATAPAPPTAELPSAEPAATPSTLLDPTLR
jgi:hypothetical protein